MQAVVRDLEGVARQADIASDDEVERARTWQLVEAARADLPGSRKEEHEFAEPLRRLQEIYTQAVEEGKVPPARQDLLDGVLSALIPEVLNQGGSEADLRRSRSKLSDLMSRMVHTVADPCEGGPPLSTESRAGQVWSELARVKLALVRDVNDRRFAQEEFDIGKDLLVRVGGAGTALCKARDNEELVRQQERETLRRLALEIREFAVRDHLGVCKPALACPPVVRDPNAVFFAGSDRARQCAAQLCRKRGLFLLGQSESHDPAQARQDDLRTCNIAIFDLSDELAPVCYDLGVALALGRPVVVTARREVNLPFDVDIEPVRLDGSRDDEERLSIAIDHAMYGLQRSGKGSSVAATLEHLRQLFGAHADSRVVHTLKGITGETARDAVEARRQVEDLLRAFGADAPQVVLPAWPVSYPSEKRKRCFHVSPFGPEWAGTAMEVTEQASRSAGIEYVRGDRVPDPGIIRSIWENICTATHVVVDLTGLNPNVTLELGMTRVLGRNALLVTQDERPERYFPAVAKVRMHRYSVNSSAGLQQLRTALSEFLSGRRSSVLR
jgi:hypothetical protein